MLASDDRMERLLRVWEDYWFLIDVWNRVSRALGYSSICKREKAVVNYSRFRKALLGIQHTSVFDCSEFCQPTDIPQGKPWSHPHIWTLPAVIGAWCKHSRRIYSVKPDLQALLEATSLEGVTWADVDLPFHSFAIRLGQPITGDLGISYDYVLVNTSNVLKQHDDDPDRWMRTVYLVRSGVATYQPLSTANRQNIENRMARKQWQHAEEVIIHYLRKLHVAAANYFTLYEEYEDEPVLTSAERIYKDAPAHSDFKRLIVPLFNRAVRVVVGMSLYLKTLPSGNPHQSEWKKVTRPAIPDSRAITNEAEVCTVSSCYVLTRQERVMLGLEGEETERAQYQLSCHFREGHWRRPPGQGHISDAPKTVHVRPTIVRRDRLQAEQLPDGLQKVM